jgi:Adenylate cyclase associated (CAP) C terminal
VSAAAAKPTPSAASAQKARGPASKALKQNRWEVENYVGGGPVAVEAKRDQTLYIAHCSNTVVQVRARRPALRTASCVAREIACVREGSALDVV